MSTLPVVHAVENDCWNRIGIRGDRSCPELLRVGHCHNCPVFAAAGRHFLDAPSPPGYLEEWTQRLASPIEQAPADLCGVLIFRLAEEWLALPVQVLLEVTTPRPVHRIPHRGGILAGLVNIRGELHLCAHLEQVLGLARPRKEDGPKKEEVRSPRERLLVVRRDAERWVFRVDEVDQVHRLPLRELTRVPATVGRASSRLTRGVFHWEGRPIGLVDDERLFATLRSRMR
jgi:chemotaxis-related protein WspD